MQNFKTLNLIFGWLVFAIATAVYLLTIEPTASFWDCGEFIACCNKLLVGHPPGAPFYIMLGRVFVLFSPNNAAVMVNAMSALASSFTILFLFWSIVHIMMKMFHQKDGSYSGYDMLVIFGAAAVGALAYTFSDTFWFSAVEAEVYAMSSLFTAVVFWAILKWESEAHEPYANRWLILIAYLMGLSIGVHLLNLLAIPAIVMVYYFKKYKVTGKGLLYAAAVAILILFIALYGSISYVWLVGSWFELLFVNGFGMGYNSGLLFYVVLLFGTLGYAVWYTHKRGKVLANTIVLCGMVLLMGCGSYAMILIRSSANVSMDQNSPDNIFALKSYLAREQYGKNPLFYGQFFSAPVTNIVSDGVSRAALDGRYEIVDERGKHIFHEDFTTIFPRMYSSDPSHIDFYENWNGGFRGRPVRTRNAQGEPETVRVPTFADNLRFFFSYQVNFMYWRYFMWNFAGRQNDQQGHGEVTNGNWISGIPFIDNARLGDQSLLPDSMKDNKGRNRLYMLPLLLGLAGVIFQYRRSKKDFSVVALLFFFTGIAIVIYLNQTPFQPRERDYAYAGSFYAFCIWIGIGVAALAELLRRATSAPVLAGGVATVASLALVPGLMAKENWDDHDRSNRHLARDFAYNYLHSCKPNSVLFTFGDNDTFPLWYIQEVEDVRTDVRLMNLSYSSADWYIRQLQKAYYESAPLPLTLTWDKVVGNRRSITPVSDQIQGPVNIKQAMDFVVSDEPRTKTRSQWFGMEFVDFFPSRTLRLQTHVENAIASGIIEDDPSGVLPHIDINLSNHVLRSQLAQLDLLANFEWSRPIQWGVTVGNQGSLGLERNLQNEGYVNLLVPRFTTGPGRTGGNDMHGSYTNADSNFHRIMNVYKFRGLNDPNVYYTETCKRMMDGTTRTVFMRTIVALLNEDKTEQAKELLNKYMDTFLPPQLSLYYSAPTIVDLFHFVGEHERANEVSDIIAYDAEQWLRHFHNIRRRSGRRHNVEQEFSFALQHVRQLRDAALRHEQTEQAERLSGIFEMYSSPTGLNLSGGHSN